jgi:hypothetical protein
VLVLATGAATGYCFWLMLLLLLAAAVHQPVAASSSSSQKPAASTSSMHASRFMDAGSFMHVCMPAAADACARVACVL